MLAAARRTKAVDTGKLGRVTIDTTAQTKAIAHPTDTHLLLRSLGWLNRFARRHGIVLRQSFVRLAVRARREVGRLIHGFDRLEVYLSHTRGIVSPTIKCELKRRSAIEPVIGHMKADGKLERHWLQGTHGDAVNVVLVAAGHNIRLLLNWLRRYFALFLDVILVAVAIISTPRGRTMTV